MKVLTPCVCQYGKKTIFQLLDEEEREVFRAVSMTPEKIPEAVEKGTLYNLEPNQTIELQSVENGQRFSHTENRVVKGDAAGSPVEESIVFNTMPSLHKRLKEENIAVKLPELAES